jgi:hypothetical protein
MASFFFSILSLSPTSKGLEEIERLQDVARCYQQLYFSYQ